MATRREAHPSHPTSGVQQKAEQAASSVGQQTSSFKRFMEKFYHDWSLHLVQALTYALITAILPIAMLLLVIIGDLIGGLNKKLQTQLVGTNGLITRVLPAPLNAGDVHQSALDKLQSASGLLIVVAVIAAIFFGSRLFTLLEACFDIVYRVPQRPFKQKNLTAIIMLLVFVILTPVLALASLLPTEALAIVQNTPINTGSSTLQGLTGFIGSLIVSFLLFEIMYVFIPNRGGALQRRMRASVPGAVTAAIALQFFLFIFQLYTRYFMNGIVGQIFFVIAIVVFFYLVALAIMIGATVNAYYSEHIQPTAHDLIARASRSN